METAPNDIPEDDETPELEADASEEETSDVEVSDEEAAEGSGLGLDIGSTSEVAAPVIRLPSRLRGRTMADGTIVATGRRKTAVARVRVKHGTGKFVVNDRPMEEFFRVEHDRVRVNMPLKTVGLDGQLDIWVRVAGGGLTGQAGAIVLGIARALQTMQPELHGTLSDNGLLTRDDRMVERKKYGHRKARRSFQFSKR